MGNRFNRTPDDEQKIVAATQYTATATSTAVNIPSVGAGDEDLDLILNLSVKTGTHDSTNHFKVELEAGETSGGTYYIVDGFSVTSDVLELGAAIFALNTRQISEAVGSQDAAYFRIVVTKVGTTATDITTSAYFARGV